jgi:hypothetical protein
MAASLRMPPRDKCPGCHSAIYNGAREQGWCTDCMPPEIDALRRQLSRRKFSDVLRDAVASALDARGDAERFEEADLNARAWFAMYQAQCSATDRFAKIAGEKSDKALLARIAELEAQIEALNRRLTIINEAHGLAHKAAQAHG